MKQVAAFIFALALAACTSMTPSLNAELQASYRIVESYVVLTRRALATNRITVDQAEQASTNAKAAQFTLDQARAALIQCRAVVPCPTYTAVMSGVQPALLSFEAELRARQGE